MKSLVKKLTQFTPTQLTWLKRQCRRTGTPVNILLRQMVDREMNKTSQDHISEALAVAARLRGGG